MPSKYKRSRSAGFLLLEKLLALAFGAVALFVVVYVSIEAMEHIRSSNRVERMHATAVVVSDSLAYWTKQAGRAENISGNLVLTYRDPSDGLEKTKTYSRSGNVLLLDGEALSGDDVAVKIFSFSLYPHSVRYSIDMAPMSGGEESFSATTTVAIRR
jgi:hypothetical protein